MRSLIIDHGNTTIKLQLWEKKGDAYENVYAAKYEQLNIEELSSIIESWNPERCGICGVEKLEPRTIETLRNFFEDRILIITPATPLPIKVRYESKSTLGPDRVAAAAGANRLFGNEGVLIVDCGTAITMDILSSHNFMCGNISPGLRLRFSSLHEAAPALPLVSVVGDVPPFGYDTPTAIRSGVIEGMISEIEGACRRAGALFGINRYIMTGGDADYLSSLLAAQGLNFEVRPWLVSEGILAIMDYNL